MLLKYCRPVGYPGDLQVHPRVDPYPYFATRYGYVLNPQLSKPVGNNPGIDWVNPRQTLHSRKKVLHGYINGFLALADSSALLVGF